MYPIYPARIVRFETRHLTVRDMPDHDRPHRRRTRGSRLRSMLAGSGQ
jgi:hypothetical protein